MLPKVCCITCTKNRFTLLSRLVGMFIEQDYEGEHILIILNNSETCFLLDDITLPPNKKILVINQSTSFKTNQKYTNLGEIYNDALLYIPERAEILNFMDDDDIFLPNHISEGVKGIIKAVNLKAYTSYKPQFSYYWGSEGISLANNVLEPSIFVLSSVVRMFGFNERNVDLHHKWLNQADVYADKEGVPTFCYDWSGKFPCFKTSGAPDNPENFQNYDKFSIDRGNGVLRPWGREQLNFFYEKILTTKF